MIMDLFHAKKWYVYYRLSQNLEKYFTNTFNAKNNSNGCQTESL